MRVCESGKVVHCTRVCCERGIRVGERGGRVRVRQCVRRVGEGKEHARLVCQVRLNEMKQGCRVGFVLPSPFTQ